MANLLDLMSDADRQKMVERYNRRMANRSEYDNEISNEVYVLAEFGYYYGWDAVMAVRNNLISMQEMYALLEGARKVWYTKLVETGRMTVTSVASPMAKNPQSAFKKGMKDFTERSFNG